MNIDHVLWDWNGTILDDAWVGLSVMNDLLVKYGKPPLSSLEDYREAFCFPVIDYYTRVGLPREQFAVTSLEWVDGYYALDDQCALQKGVLAALEAFHARGASQAVLSAQQIDRLKTQAARYPIGQYFDEFMGLSHVYATSKVHLGKEWLARTGAKPENTLFIGDTLHDKQTADAIGCRCALVACGHQARAALESAGCPVFADPGEVAAHYLSHGA